MKIAGDGTRRRKEIVGALVGGMAGAALAARGLRWRRAIDLAGRTALITGGSRGLGLLIGREMGRQGARVTLAARDARELDQARSLLAESGIDAAIVVGDVCDRIESERLVDDVMTRHGRLDVVVNNAGLIQVGPFEHMDVPDYQNAMAAHFWGPLYVMRAAVPHMRAQGGGRIVNISSIGGKIGVPHLAAYCASKFALTGLSTSLRAELVKDGILVTTVSPGLMRTGSPFNAWFKGRHRDEFTWFAISDSLPLISIDAGRAAWQIVDACRHGDAELCVGWPATLAVMANAIAPAVVASVMALVNRLLPGPIDARGDGMHRGWQSASRWAPSLFTRLTDRAAVENNELPATH